MDERDEFLFENLLRNARASVKDLATALDVSQATIIKRIRALEEKEFILRYDAIINWQKLPLIKKVYFFKRSKNSIEFEKTLVSRTCVFSIIRINGLYDYQVWCFFKTQSEQTSFEKSLKKIPSIRLLIQELVFPRQTFFDVPRPLPIPKCKSKNILLDTTDIALMKYVAQGHGRDSLYAISKSLGVPYDTVHYHGRKLLSSDYFSAIIAQPGRNAFGLQTTCLLIECQTVIVANTLYTALKTAPRILSVAIGGITVLVHFLSKNQSEYQKTFKDILTIVPRELVSTLIITYWSDIVLNNRYPLEYLLT